MRFLFKFAVAGAVLLLGIFLIAAIYFTLFDLQWIAFLAGVLFAAVSALTSQSARAQWLVLRRGRQLERTRALLAKEIARRERSENGLETMETRFRSVSDALTERIVFVDPEGRCRYHNRAFEQWCGRSADKIDGLPLRDVVNDAVYNDIVSHCADALAGKEVRYDAVWPRQAGGTENRAVTLLPYPAGTVHPSGYYALIARVATVIPAPAAAPRAEAAVKVAVQQDVSGETVYLDSMAEQLGGDDPREQLVQALRDDDFILFAQKIEPVAAGAGGRRCLEILLRLQEEERQMLPPGGFFPAAEHFGLMGEIDRWVVRNLLEWCAEKRRGDVQWQMPQYCVNISNASLLDPEFPRDVKKELVRCGVPGEQLCFEIAELDLINHGQNVKTFMNFLKSLGCRFTADSFGSIRVSFAPFKDLNFDFVKIDGTIIQNVLREPSDLAKARAIVLACRKIGIRTIAEFVESPDMLIKLREIGIDYAQGFGIGKPEPLAEIP